MAALHLNLFGAPELIIGDGGDALPVHFDTRKALALLAYLAVTGKSHTRDSLAALLWPEGDAEHARSALRRTLSALTAVLGPQPIEAGRQTIGLHPQSTLACDVTRFLAAIAHSRSHGHPPAASCPDCRRWLQEAAELYRGDFMAGFSLRDSLEFDDWQLIQAEHLRREHAAALDRLSALLIDDGDLAAALPYARRWLNLDPLHEPAHARLMQLYAWSGQQSAALRQYQDCAHILERELGVAPLQETTALCEAIRERRLPTPAPRAAAPAPAAPAPRPAAHPLVGRHAELTVLRQAYTADSTRLLVISGEAGIGKSRLAEEFLADVQAQGGVVLAAACYEGESGLAYGPLLAALRCGLAESAAPARLRGLSTHSLTDCARLLPELGASPTSPADGPGAQARLFEALYELLLALLAGERPGVLFIDDVQWADDATFDLLAFAARRLQRQGLHGALPRLLVAWRSEEVGPEHRWARLLGEARRANAAQGVALARLSPAAAGEMVHNAWGMGADARLVERLLRESEGLPFVLTEYLALLQPGDELLDADWPLPATVQALLHAHLARIGETAWQTLTAAAVIGRSFDFETVRAASGRSEDETIAALEELAAKGLAAELPPAPASDAGAAPPGVPRYDFRHDKLRALVYDETSLARRRLLHRRVAVYLAEGARDPRKAGPAAGTIARHYQLGGEMEKAAVFFQLAGDHAAGVYAHAEAQAHYRAALAAGHPHPGPLHEAIGDLLTLAGDYPAALRAFASAALYGAAGDGDVATLARLEHKVGRVHHRQGDWHAAERHFQAALAAAGEDGGMVLGAAIYADWSLTAYRMDARGGARRALALAGQALALAQQAGDARALAQAHNLFGILAKHGGQTETAAGHLRQSLALARDLADPGAQAAALNNLALLYAANGDLPQALDLAAQALDLCIASGDRHRQAALLNHLADLLHAAGRDDEAMARLKQAVQIFAEVGADVPGALELQPEIWKLEEW